MAAIHCYIGYESIALSAAQRTAFANAMRGLGKQADAQPCKVNHARIRTDALAMLCESEFDDGELTIPAFKGYLGAIFGVNPALITHAASTNVYGLLVTFAYLGTDYLRALLFGGAGTTLADSRAAVRAYLAANASAWGDA